MHKYTSSPGHSNPKGRKQGLGPSSRLQENTASSSQLPELSLEKHFGFLERKALRKYRELDWKVPLFVIWRMSVVFEGNHSSFKAKTMAKNNRGAAGSQRNTKVLSTPKPRAVQPLHTHDRMSPVRHGKTKLHQEICPREATHLQVPPRDISPTADLGYTMSPRSA